MVFGDTCYLCGKGDDLTRDHIPPQGMFPGPRPGNLITVPCCKTCNSTFSMDDELFRAWASSGAQCSAAGKQIWRGKVVPSFATRNKKLRQQMRQDVGTAALETLIGRAKVPIIGIPVSRAKPFIVRITKGLLHHFYPDYNYTDIHFTVVNVAPTPQYQTAIKYLLPHLIYDERGEGVFRFWRGFTVDAPDVGVWIYLFYDAACFLVRHGRVAFAEQRRQ